MMNNQDILNRVIEVLSTMSEFEDISEDSELVEDLEISSMDILYLTCSLEAEFNIKIPEKEIRKMSTVGDIAETVLALMK